MLSKLSIRIHAYAKGWSILGIFLALMVLNAVFLPTVLQQVQTAANSTTALEGLDTTFFYTPEKAFAIIGSYNDTVRNLYRNYELTLDIVEAVLYSSFFSLLISWLFQRWFKPASRMQKLNVVALVAGISDVLENICIVTMITAYPAQLTLVAWLSTLCTMSKWVFIGVSVLLVLLGLVNALLSGFRKQYLVPAS